MANMASSDGTALSASSPDIPNLLTLQNENENHQFPPPLKRSSSKRKFIEDDMEAMLERFQREITSSLSSMQLDIERKISSIQDDINKVIKSELSNIKCEMKSLNTNQTKLFADMSSLRESLEYHANEQKHLQQKVVGIETFSKSTNQDCCALKSDLIKLQSEMNIHQQRERSHNLEITGIPDRNKENLSLHVMKIASFVGVQLSSQDIEYVTRIQPRTKVPGRPRVIIVKLRSRLLRDSVLSGVRAKRGITTNDIEISGETRKIYVNEHLTPTNKLLYKNTRERSKAKNYQYTWIRDGKIFVRRVDTSPSVLIRGPEDLQKIT